MTVQESKTKAFAYFLSRGWTPAQAAGIVANLVAESRLNPAAIGDGGSAYGINQAHPDRQARFEQLFGKPMQGSTLDEQLVFVDHELNDQERAAGAALHACLTPEQAGSCVSLRYERPADHMGEANLRAKLAADIFAEWSAAGIPAPSDAPAAPDVQTPAEPAPVPQKPDLPVSQPPKEGPTVPAFALTFLQPVLSALIEKFAPRTVAAIDKVTGQSPTETQNLLNSLLGVVAGNVGIPVTDKSSAVQAVAAATANAQAVADAEAHVLDYLDKISPLLDKMYANEQRREVAAETSANNAANRVAKYPTSVLMGITCSVIAMGVILLGGLVAVAIVGMVYPGAKGVANEILTIISMLGTLVFRDISAMVRSVFGNNDQSDADAINAQTIRQANDKAK